MKRKFEILTLIPARAGSKGIKNKNLVELEGKPLIVYTIEAAVKSQFVQEIYISTDSKEIAATGEPFGIHVQRLRPPELATDGAKSMDVFMDAIHYYESMGKFFSHILILQPTSPLRTSEDIDNAVRLMMEKQANAIVSVCKNTEHPWLSNTLPDDFCMKDFIRPEVVHKNRQEMPVFYRLNGAIYLVSVDYLKKHKTFYGPKTFAYVMPLERSVDIDEPVDLLLAAQLLKIKNDKNERL